MTKTQKILALGTLAGLIATGCGNSDAGGPVGTLTMALTATKGTTTYRLVGATFDLSGAESRTVAPSPDAARLNVDLQAGDYSITLRDGWHMESSVDGGAYATVSAVLDSPATQTFSIFAEELTYLTYSFRAGPDVMAFGDGRLVLQISVNDGVNGACAVAHPTCGQSTVTCAGHSATIQNSCQFATGPEGTTISCGSQGTTIPSGFGIAPNGYGDTARLLADLQRRLLAFFEAHGTFPVASAAATPMSTCCAAGGVFQCPANPNAWHGVAAWDALDNFSIDTAHSFVFSYNCTGGDWAQVIATGDLDCDTTSIDYVLTCTATNGNPSCTLTLPVVCTGDYE